jgi:hypothetical protein
VIAVTRGGSVAGLNGEYPSGSRGARQNCWAWLEECLLGEQSFNSFNYLGSSALRNCALKASVTCFSYQLRGYFLNGEKQHRGVRRHLRNLASRFQTIHAGHRQIEDGNVRGQLFGLLNGFLAIRCFAAHLPIWALFQQAAEKPADGSIVIGNQDANWHVHCEVESERWSMSFL